MIDSSKVKEKGRKKGMTREQFEKWYETYHKGTYVVVEKETAFGEFTRRVKAVTRFVNYYNIESVKARGKGESKPREYEEQIIPHVLKHNHNTGNDLVLIYTTNHHKAYATYYWRDIEISEEEYYLMSGDKKKNWKDSLLYMFKLEDIKRLGK